MGSEQKQHVQILYLLMQWTLLCLIWSFLRVDVPWSLPCCSWAPEHQAHCSCNPQLCIDVSSLKTASPSLGSFPSHSLPQSVHLWATLLHTLVRHHGWFSFQSCSCSGVGMWECKPGWGFFSALMALLHPRDGKELRGNMSCSRGWHCGWPPWGQGQMHCPTNSISNILASEKLERGS